jgi:hypothetical protein
MRHFQGKPSPANRQMQINSQQHMMHQEPQLIANTTTSNTAISPSMITNHALTSATVTSNSMTSYNNGVHIAPQYQHIKNSYYNSPNSSQLHLMPSSSPSTAYNPISTTSMRSAMPLLSQSQIYTQHSNPHFHQQQLHHQQQQQQQMQQHHHQQPQQQMHHHHQHQQPLQQQPQPQQQQLQQQLAGINMRTSRTCFYFLYQHYLCSCLFYPKKTII